LIVVLGVPFHTEGLHLEQGHAAAGARAVDGPPGRVVGREHVVAVDRLPPAAVRNGLVRERPRRRLPVDGGRVRVPVVLDHDDERKLLHRREVDPLGECARRRAAVADVDHPDYRLLLHPPRERDSRHHRDHVAEHRDRPEEAALHVREVDVEVAAAAGGVPLRHVLPEDVDGFPPGDQDGSEVADEGRDDVAAREVERVRRGHGLSLLPQRAIDAADGLSLTEERDDPLLQRAGEPEVIRDIEEAVARERTPRLGGL
jgi:hypothetical protein